MTSSLTQFAQSTSTSGIGAFNLNVKEFLFQLATFVIVLWVIKRWVLPKIIETLEQRRQTLEQGLVHAKQTEEVLAKAEARAEEVLARARAHADEALAEAKKAAGTIIVNAEEAAAKRARLIVKEAEEHLAQERDKLRDELRGELAELVADATEKLIHEKLDSERDMSLIERAIRGLAG